MVYIYDSHISTLLTRTKSPTPKLEHSSPSQHFHQPNSPHVEIPSSMSTNNMYTSNTGFRPPHPNVLLQQLYAVGPSSNTNPSPVNHPHQEHAPTDPLQLLAQAQAQRGQYASQSQMPPQNMSLPPHFSRPPPGMYDSLPPRCTCRFPTVHATSSRARVWSPTWDRARLYAHAQLLPRAA